MFIFPHSNRSSTPHKINSILRQYPPTIASQYNYIMLPGLVHYKIPPNAPTADEIIAKLSTFTLRVKLFQRSRLFSHHVWVAPQPYLIVQWAMVNLIQTSIHPQ